MVDYQSIIQNIIIWAPGILLAITLHEWAHGFAASRFGDHTPEMMGRLTLNPIPHIDLVWTILIPAMMLVTSLATTGKAFVFGGAKPVPINPRNFKGNLRLALFTVAIAGPAMNILLALVCALAVHGAILLPEYFGLPLMKMLIAAIQMNVLLAVFNMLPLPPLDGGRVATALLPYPWSSRLAGLERFGLIIVLALAFSGFLSVILWPPMLFLLNIFLSIAGLI